VRGGDGFVRPAELFEDLANGEGLDEVPELGESRRVPPVDLGGAEAEEPGGQTGVDQVDLGEDRDARAECPTPRR
jgi:hypothetical protein